MVESTEASADAARYLQQAIDVGREGMRAHRGGPFGAIVVAPDGTVAGAGCNEVTSTSDPTAHAEVMAIRAACAGLGTFLLDGFTLYTSCEPCPMCLAAAYWARVKAIVYGATRADAASAGFDDAFIYDEIGQPLDARQIPMRQLMGGPAATLFEEWRAMDDRTPY